MDMHGKYRLKKKWEEYITSLELRYPNIQWRKPILIETFGGSKGLACRICIAKYGLYANEVKFLPNTEEGHVDHLRNYHFLEP